MTLTSAGSFWTRTRASFGVALVLSLLPCPACEPKDRSPIKSAEFGIFYGGQIQERQELPFQLDETKQQQGFRITFNQPLPEPAQARWEISRPAPRSHNDLPVSRPEGRVTEVNETTIPQGANTFEKRIAFAAGEPLGLWNLRVTIDDRVAIDRPFTVYDRSARRRAIREHKRRDAGL